jgi:hypothetical protein
MSSTPNPGRVAGFWYLLLSVIAPLRLMLFPAQLSWTGTDRLLLQRIQERKECLLIFGAQLAEAIPYVFGLAAVAFDGAF